jgi:hypothetical protein
MARAGGAGSIAVTLSGERDPVPDKSTVDPHDRVIAHIELTAGAVDHRSVTDD